MLRRKLQWAVIMAVCMAATLAVVVLVTKLVQGDVKDIADGVVIQAVLALATRQVQVIDNFKDFPNKIYYN